MFVESIETEILEMTSEDVADALLIEKENNLSHWSDESYRTEIKNKDSIALSIKFKGKLAGFIIARLIITDQYNKQNIKQNYETEILNIAITKSLQNKGLGQKLLDKFFKTIETRDVSEIWLEVRETNLQAINFYKKNGFSIQFKRKNYYTNPTENALIMKKIIDFSKKLGA